ncbi:hypothetical protein FEM48_Zijuj03G0183400 [Ziziphus jujuba var. spinosa]|uniref:Uncharacterized protein n=1 Tax=Ziziphus jujuba var. spinosa TaxID=714518 RepID=A0A978VRW1_ZIZJJ|nr:hypothetical protein FEM48_Zijuj03G0183400 [Ziziphus jujuba var. spinosa]
MKSVEHRVLATQGVKARVSVACFFNSDDKLKPYGPIKELLSENNPPLYKDTNYIEFATHYQGGSATQLKDVSGAIQAKHLARPKFDVGTSVNTVGIAYPYQCQLCQQSKIQSRRSWRLEAQLRNEIVEYYKGSIRIRKIVAELLSESWGLNSSGYIRNMGLLKLYDIDVKPVKGASTVNIGDMMQMEASEMCELEKEVKQFCKSKGDVKGLVDCGITCKVPRIFIHSEPAEQQDDGNMSMFGNLSCTVCNGAGDLSCTDCFGVTKGRSRDSKAVTVKGKTML